MRTLFGLLLMCFVAAAEEPVIPGTEVSRPLTPVEVVEAPTVEPAVELPPTPSIEGTLETGHTGLRQSWSSYELLLWWSKAEPIPSLVTGSTGNSPPVLGGPETQVLVGGSSLGDRLTAGFRFTMGWTILTLDGENKLGFEFSGLFLGTRVGQVSFRDSERGRFTQIGRPFNDASTGQASALLVSGIGAGTGGVQITSTTRVQGWEVSLVRNVVDAGDARVSAIGGYRYLGVNEGLSAAQTSLRFPAPGVPPTVLWNAFDQFDARNNFHGGQIGLAIDGGLGRWLFTFRGTVALGTNFETLAISGGSSATTAALPLPAVQPFHGGFLTSSTNIGRGTQAHLAYVPEGRLSLGYRLGDHCHLVAGYDFLYLSNAVRPGDQVDLTIDAARSPIANSGAGLGPNRPAVSFARSDFWTQGLTLGLDCRY